jgi:hypothetical protein
LWFSIFHLGFILVSVILGFVHKVFFLDLNLRPDTQDKWAFVYERPFNLSAPHVEAAHCFLTDGAPLMIDPLPKLRECFWNKRTNENLVRVEQALELQVKFYFFGVSFHAWLGAGLEDAILPFEDAHFGMLPFIGHELQCNFLDPFRLIPLCTHQRSTVLLSLPILSVACSALDVPFSGSFRGDA